LCLLEIRIRNQLTPVASVTVRSLNFGQRVREVVSDYQISISLKQFVTCCESYYSEFVDDDRLLSDEQAGIVVMEARALGWPALLTLAIQTPTLFEQFTLRHLAFDFLQNGFAEPNHDLKPDFLIISIEGVALTEHIVSIRGNCIALS
jgi:hypothetical protein